MLPVLSITSYLFLITTLLFLRTCTYTYVHTDIVLHDDVITQIASIVTDHLPW